MPSAVQRLPLPVQAAALRATTTMPKVLRRALAGRRIRIDGQQLALDAQVAVRMHQLSGTSITDSDPALARAQLDDAARIAAGRPIEPVATRDVTIPAAGGPRRARLYTPDRCPAPSPLLLYVHGGAFMAGSIDSHDQIARFLAKQAGLRVLSVEYRLAPEDPFPAGVEDVLDAFDYVHAHAGELGADPARIAIGGDSAGGNLSAVVSHLTIRRGGPAPAFQLLLYPTTDFASRHRSRDLFAEDLFLTDTDIERAKRFYTPDSGDWKDPRVSILLAEDLSGLPPAYLVTAGFDPLRDEGEAYAHAMRDAGVPVILRRQDDLIHGFASFLGAGVRFREATLEVASALRTGLGLLG